MKECYHNVYKSIYKRQGLTQPSKYQALLPCISQHVAILESDTTGATDQDVSICYKDYLSMSYRE